MCEVPIFVMTAISGRAAAVIRDSSPKWFMPISSTAARVDFSMRSTVSGMPTSLFRLPSVLRVSQCCPSTAATISLVVVLPTEPVTPTTLAGISAR